MRRMRPLRPPSSAPSLTSHRLTLGRYSRYSRRFALLSSHPPAHSSSQPWHQTSTCIYCLLRVRIIYPPPPLFFLFLPLRSLHPLLHLHFTHSLRACVRAVIATGTPGGHIRSRTLSQIDLLYHACSARGRPHACCLSICQSVHMRTLARSCLPAPRLYTLFCTSLFTRTILFARPKLVHTLHLNMRHACMENKIVARHRRSQSEHQ